MNQFNDRQNRSLARNKIGIDRDRAVNKMANSKALAATSWRSSQPQAAKSYERQTAAID